MPVLPGITDAPAQIEALVARIADSKASYVGACALRLRSTARQRYLPFIEAEFPELAERYRSTYSRGHQVGERYRDGLRERFREVCAKYNVSFDRRYRIDADDAEAASAEASPAPPSTSAQFALFAPGAG
jgi:DNA repair photolyase